MPAGLNVRFETDAPEIRLRWHLEDEALGSPKMPPLGRSGFDLYAEDENGQLRWASASNGIVGAKEEQPLIGELDGRTRRFTLYLPVMNPLLGLQIGVPETASFAAITPRTERYITYYGTSIAHGACVSRPGMAIPAILSRRLDEAVMNIAFSGNAIMEPEIADLLAELDPVLYVLDALPNMDKARIEENAEPFIRRLRGARPVTPIVLVEDRTYTNGWILTERRTRNDESRAAFRKIYEALVGEGMPGLTYVEGETLFGTDDEASMDGSHPSDLGTMRQAEVLEPILRDVLP
jgi:lysophospholipase L1-like esterase